MTQYTHMVEVEVSEDGTQTVTPSVLFGLISHLKIFPRLKHKLKKSSFITNLYSPVAG